MDSITTCKTANHSTELPKHITIGLYSFWSLWDERFDKFSSQGFFSWLFRLTSLAVLFSTNIWIFFVHILILRTPSNFNDDEITKKQLTYADVDQACLVLAKAAMTDPRYVVLIPDSEKRFHMLSTIVFRNLATKVCLGIWEWWHHAVYSAHFGTVGSFQGGTSCRSLHLGQPRLSKNANLSYCQDHAILIWCQL